MTTITVTTGTVMAISGNTIFYTSNGLALGTEQSTEVTVPLPPAPEFIAGKYVPTTWPSAKPWKY